MVRNRSYLLSCSFLLIGACQDPDAGAEGSATGEAGTGSGDGDGDGDGSSAGDGDGDGDGDSDSSTSGDGDGDGDGDCSAIDTAAFPADRIAHWNGQVGVEGGIPDRDVERNCVTEDGVPSDGQGDAAPGIRACLANTPAGTVAYLPAGTYRIESSEDGSGIGLTIPAEITLRGDGPDLTILSAETGLDSIVQIGAGHSENPLVPITAGFEAGSSEFTLENAANVEVGDLLLLNELNDADLPVTAVSGWGDGSCDWCDQFGATRLRAQVVEVTGKNGNTLDIGPQELFHDFSADRAPMAMLIDQVHKNAGVEDLAIVNGSGASDGWRVNVMMRGAANSWLKNTRVENCGKRCIDMRTYFYRLEVRDSLITGCIDHANSDACYGTEIAEGSNSLIENNIYDNTSNGPIAMWGASGNVIGYNYIHQVFRTHQQDSWFWPNSWTHGAHTSYNLWEGNDFAGLNWDSYWGSNSHNTAFRNRIDGKNMDQPLVDGHIETAAIIVETNNTYASVVGNVLGTAGWSDAYEVIDEVFWGPNAIYGVGMNGDNVSDTLFRHDNYDYVSEDVTACDAEGEPGCYDADVAAPLPDSLYRCGKPSWFGDVAWPPVDPYGPTVADIPAKLRF